MHVLGVHYFPLTMPFFMLLSGLFILMFFVVLFKIVRHAYIAMGLAPQYVLTVLLLSLIGSYINIPIIQLPGEHVATGQDIFFYGMGYVLPVEQDWPGTLIAVNVGGAVIPTLLSLYLLMKNGLYLKGLVGIVIVAAICHSLAQPVPGLGIAIPVFVPPVATAVVALLLARAQAGPLAYIIGSLGTLIGADLLNLDKVAGLGAPVMSIGGAGTFDGIFVTGLMAVLFASLASGRRTGSQVRAL
jgi:uncharacterized membrane protein